MTKNPADLLKYMSEQVRKATEHFIGEKVVEKTNTCDNCGWRTSDGYGDWCDCPDLNGSIMPQYDCRTLRYKYWQNKEEVNIQKNIANKNW